MNAERKKLTDELRRAGISKAAIEAAWPRWWDDTLAESPSGRAEPLEALDLTRNLSPTRRNGLAAVRQAIRAFAQRAAAKP